METNSFGVHHAQSLKTVRYFGVYHVQSRVTIGFSGVYLSQSLMAIGVFQDLNCMLQRIK